MANLLQEQNASPFRINAYRKAASSIEQYQQPVSNLVEQKGLAGLIALPGIGERIARSIYKYVAMGRMSRLESLRGEHDPVAMFEQVPGIGATLAHRLEKVRDFSENKIRAIKAWLAQVLGQRRLQSVSDSPKVEPDVGLILKIDQIYREKAEAGKLPTIAPKRFNPQGEAWLAVLHASKKGWHFTALLSNTARAHELKRTKDWVVIFFYNEHHHENQCTVVTETRGALIGERVVRGREE